MTDAGSVPCSTTNIETPTVLGWGFFLPDRACSRVLVRVQLHEFWADAFAAPALKACLTGMPARGQLFLVEVNDFHFGLFPNGLAGIHEGAVSHASQAICRADPFSAFFAEIDAVVLRKLFQESA
jgi:hypothetical protein